MIMLVADVNAMTLENDNLLLHWTVSSDDFIFAKILLLNGALVRVKNQHSITAMYNLPLMKKD